MPSLRAHADAARTKFAMTVPERLARYLGRAPSIASSAFVAPNATGIGDVTLGAHSSVWYGSVLRGDINSIVIGEGTNVQDGTIVHLADDYGVRARRFGRRAYPNGRVECQDADSRRRKGLR